MASFIITDAVTAAPLAPLTYPRTGKRGVPQQFPRRLYEMLESEAKLATTDSEHEDIISWSDSGKAFRIVNVALFASRVLPKYFRTSKFSSFQRNLNLYGFAKVRRGPDTDMYANPSFLRGHPDSLSELRKFNSTAARKKGGAPALPPIMSNCGLPAITAGPSIIIPAHLGAMGFSRTVSPSPPQVMVAGNQQVQQPVFSYHHIVPMPTPTSEGAGALHQVYTPTLWHHQVTAPPQQQPQMVLPSAAPVSPGGSDSGRLDLLTMAMTSMAEHEANTHQATAVQTA